MLFFTVDLLSPTHFRRNLNSLFVFGVMRRRPVELLLFALGFCPPIFVMELLLGDLVYNQQATATLAVAPNTVLDVPVELRIKVDFSELAGIATDELFSFITGKAPTWRDSLQARLMVKLPLGLELPLYITEGYRHAFDEG